MGSILGGVIIIGFTTYFLTGNLRRYNSAQEFFEQKTM